ncbi:MAG: AAA family ATPase [bacterium]|nr:AAA family ATPase [bacterium]
MITSVYIDNFKALNQFSIHLNPLTVLIGSNGSGKSTILQAIDMMCSLAKVDIRNYIDERKWAMSDLKSYLNSKQHITFRATFLLEVSRKIENIQWEIVLHPEKERETIQLVEESIFSITRNKTLLKMDSNGFERYNEEKKETEHFPALGLSLSLLSSIDVDKDHKTFPALTALKSFAQGLDSFDLLSTERIRSGYRGKTDSIGKRGEKLAGFLHSLEGEQKERLNRRLKKYVPFINGIDTIVKKESGHIEMNIAESFRGQSPSANINAIHSSDGILRLIAISALAEIEKEKGVILLDEIEDGINPYLAADLVNDLKEIPGKSQRQVIVTTHSSVLLDFFPADSVVFLWRDSDGTVNGSNLFGNEEMKASLEYMHPGEVWINMKEGEIIQKIREKS